MEAVGIFGIIFFIALMVSEFNGAEHPASHVKREKEAAEARRESRKKWCLENGYEFKEFKG